MQQPKKVDKESTGKQEVSFQPGQSEAPTGDEDDISPLTCSLRFNAVTAVVLAVDVSVSSFAFPW